ncbi:hypothetical protein NL676_010382 [Syzygium grande]|nr:hypothetical protein NL676_010382 [Syzygium grande]
MGRTMRTLSAEATGCLIALQYLLKTSSHGGWFASVMKHAEGQIFWIHEVKELCVWPPPSVVNVQGALK